MDGMKSLRIYFCINVYVYVYSGLTPPVCECGMRSHNLVHVCTYENFIYSGVQIKRTSILDISMLRDPGGGSDWT